MDTVFAGNVEVVVLRNGREVGRIVRPLRRTSVGPLVKYKGKLWPVLNDSIDVSGQHFNDGDEPPAEAANSASSADESETVFIEVGTEPTPPVVANIASSDDAQKLVIEADFDQRLLVDAGPGTGKTHTACLKVAALIRRDDIPPSRIWMISFTRTAVHEIKNRLAALLENASDAAAVRIATLDSLAWTIHSGFSAEAVLTGSYDDNIKSTLEKFRSNPQVQEDFERIRHVVVDEAQDIIGVRAELVLAIIDAAGPDCGVTVFADQAQAIYGFTEDAQGDEAAGIRLVTELEDREFRSISLTEIHRTQSPALLRIFRDVRRKVLDKDVPCASRGSEIRTEIEQLADARIGSPRDIKFDALPPTALMLMRQRSEVLTSSSFNQNTPHRLRMSGLPIRILPWLATLFWDYCERRLTKDTFAKLWKERITNGGDAEFAWQLLYQTAGESASVIDLHHLRTVLDRSNPPASFTSPEYGDAGPIIGTIHASKGREAEEVFLYLPPVPDESDEYTDADEEVRVMFVGATRARTTLAVGSSTGRRYGNFEGRYWKKTRQGDLQIEIGRLHDIDAKGLVGQSAFLNAAATHDAQRHIQQHPVMTKIFARSLPELGWNFELEAQEKLRIGVLSQKVRSDLREIANQCEWKKPITYLPYIRSIGLRSIVVRPDDSITDQLHEPWRSSGFLFAPMLLGICKTKSHK